MRVAGWIVAAALAGFAIGFVSGVIVGSPTIMLQIGDPAAVPTDVAPYCSEQSDDAIRCMSETATIGIRG